MDAYREMIARRTWGSTLAWRNFPKMSTRGAARRRWCVVEGGLGDQEKSTKKRARVSRMTGMVLRRATGVIPTVQLT